MHMYACMSVLHFLQLIPRTILSLNFKMEPVRQSGIK